MILIDANYFLRWFLNDVPSQNRYVKRVIANSEPESVIIDRVTIAGITYVLRGLKYNHYQIALAIKEFCLIDAIKPLDKTHSLALEIYRDSNFDFEDCWLVARSRSMNISLMTFDKELKKYLLS